MRSAARTLNRWLDAMTQGAALLLLPLALLLFLQWPLRQAPGAWSRQANDCAQWLFALYATFAIHHTTRAGLHLRVGAIAGRWPAPVQRFLGRFGQAVVLLPWSAFIVFSGAAPTWQSIQALEAFPDTFNPLYFVIKTSAWLLGWLVGLRALLDLAAPVAED